MSHGVLIHLMVSHGVLCLMETQYVSWCLTVCSDVVSWCLMMLSHGVSLCLMMYSHGASWCLRMSCRLSCCLMLCYVSSSLMVSHAVL